MVNSPSAVPKNENVENFNSISLISGFCATENYNAANLRSVSRARVAEKRALREEVLMLEKTARSLISLETFFGACFLNVTFDQLNGRGVACSLCDAESLFFCGLVYIPQLVKQLSITMTKLASLLLPELALLILR